MSAFQGQSAGGGLTNTTNTNSSADAQATTSGQQTVTYAGSGLVFVNNYSGVSASVQAALVAAENWFQSHFTNSVTININLNEQNLGTQFAAENTFNPVPNVSFSTLENALLNHESTMIGAAAANSLRNISDPTRGQGFDVPFAMAEILGIPLSGGATTTDSVTLNSNSSGTGFTVGDNQNTIAALEHEISEGAFGRIGGLGVQNSSWGPMDLFRYNSSGRYDTNASDASYFSYNNGSNLLLPYHTAVSRGVYDGFDVGDWEFSVNNDAFGDAGTDNSPDTISAVDVAVLEALGWTGVTGQTLWVVDSNGEIGKVNSTDGTIILVGKPSVTLTGLATSPAGGLFGISGSSFYSVNEKTGAASLIGGLGNGSGQMKGLAFGASSVLYATSSATDLLYSINLSTGQATPLSGTLGTNGTGDLAYSNGVLYFADANGNLESLAISNNTVTARVIGATGYTGITGLAAEGGVLYGVVGSQLITINTSTGAATSDLNYGNAGSATTPALAAAEGMTAAPNVVPPASSDFTGSGFSDVLWRDTSGNVSDWQFSAGNNFTVNTLATNVSSNQWVVGVGDFTGNNISGVLWRDTGGDVWEANADGSNRVSSPSMTSDWSMVGIGDFTGNGTSDVLWLKTDGTLEDWLMNGTNTPTVVYLGTVAAGWTIVGIGDFNGNGTDDILWRNVNTGDVGQWMFNNNTPTWNSLSTNTSSDWTVAGIGDFTGNGIDDILWRNTKTGYVGEWMFNSSDQPTWNLLTTSASASSTVVGIGDYSGNGIDNVLWRNTSNGTVSEWQFSSSNVPTSVQLASAVGSNMTTQGFSQLPPTAVTDFTGDHISDVLWQNTNGTLEEWQFGSNNTWNGLVLPPQSPNWSVAGQGDFNGDGVADILFRDASSGNNEEWQMNGANSPTTVALPNMSTNWLVAGIGDFTGNGIADLLWRDTSGDVEAWLMNNSNSPTTLSFSTKMDSSWQVVGTGDFTGNGVSDILWFNTNGALEDWLMNGTNAPTIVSFGTVSSGWTVAGIGDFTGDGTDDILWRNVSTGYLGEWQFANNKPTWVQLSTNVGPDWTVSGIGDYTGNGIDDILWRNTKTGLVGEWTFSNNNTPTWNTLATSMGSDWSTQKTMSTVVGKG